MFYTACVENGDIKFASFPSLSDPRVSPVNNTPLNQASQRFDSALQNNMSVGFED